jgi:hypothetical protein
MDHVTKGAKLHCTWTRTKRHHVTDRFIHLSLSLFIILHIEMRVGPITFYISNEEIRSTAWHLIRLNLLKLRFLAWFILLFPQYLLTRSWFYCFMSLNSIKFCAHGDWKIVIFADLKRLFKSSTWLALLFQYNAVAVVLSNAKYNPIFMGDCCCTMSRSLSHASINFQLIIENEKKTTLQHFNDIKYWIFSNRHILRIRFRMVLRTVIVVMWRVNGKRETMESSRDIIQVSTQSQRKVRTE